MPLTDTAVRNAKPKEKPYKLTDGDGLYLLIKPNGGKYWRFKYLYLGKEKLLSLGTYPEVPLLEARDKRHATRKLLASGTDPSNKRKEERRLAVFKAGNTFEAVAKEWFENEKPKWTPDHAARLWRRLDANIIPILGDRPISEIKPLELLEALRKVEKRGATDLSRRLLQICGSIFRYALLSQKILHNPASDLRGVLKAHKSVSHPTITAKELPDFFKKLETVETSNQNKLAIWMLMLTFVRQGELRQAKWEDVSFQDKEWRLPPHTTKMRDLHIVPLSKQTIKALKELFKGNITQDGSRDFAVWRLLEVTVFHIGDWTHDIVCLNALIAAKKEEERLKWELQYLKPKVENL